MLATLARLVALVPVLLGVCGVPGVPGVVAIVGPGGVRGVAGDELLPNGGFERGIDGWRALDMAGGTTFQPDTKVKAAGKQSLRIERSASAGKLDFLKGSVELAGATGSLAFSLALKVDKGSRVEVDAYFFDASGETVGKGYLPVARLSKPAKAFETFREELEIPERAHGFGINVKLAEPGTVWIDEVSLTRAGAAAKSKAKPKAGGAPRAPLSNGGFEDALEGWSALAGSRTATAEPDARVRSQGKHALRLERASPRLFPEDGVVARADVPAGWRRARLAYEARVEGDTRAYATLQAFDGRGVALGATRGTAAPPGEGFAAATLDLELPKGTERVAIVLAVRGRGTVWFDSVVLEEGR